MDVEALLREKFAKSSPTIRYGGSKAKGTLIRESYDLDVICYFPSSDTSAGESLKDIYDNVTTALQGGYYITPKNSSIRLKSKDPKQNVKDFHIDVVPGRYVDETKTDSFIHQNGSEKERLKTNLDVHIAHVRDSGVDDAIRLLKLWKVRKSIPLKGFVWELVIIKLLKTKKSSSLSAQLEHVWKEIRDTKDPISIEDPANPSGNDLSKVLDTSVWFTLSASAKSTLGQIQSSGWESVFGPLKRAEGASRVAALSRAAGTASVQSKPWAD